MKSKKRRFIQPSMIFHEVPIVSPHPQPETRKSHAPLGSMKPAAGVMVASPAMAPTQRPTRVGRPRRIHSILDNLKMLDVEFRYLCDV